MPLHYLRLFVSTWKHFLLKSPQHNHFEFYENLRGTDMKLHIVSKEIIKPSSPTPDDSKHFRLSLLDQLAPPSYESLLLFYHSDIIDHRVSVSDRSHQLKKSLSDALTRFYPLAGRIKDNLTIDCTDSGAVYVEAQINCRLADFLEKPDGEAARKFVPAEFEAKQVNADYFLLLVQSSFFNCGGLAIGVCLSHKIADAATLSTFVKGWAAASLGSGQAVFRLYDPSALLPPREFSSLMLPDVNFTKDKCVIKRFVFDAAKIAALQTISASTGVQQPTREEAVTALIWKCATNASRSNSGYSKLSVLSQCVNIREKIVPPLPDNSVGNLVGYFVAQKDESDIELQGLVHELRKETQEFSKNYINKLQREDALEVITEHFKDAISILISHDLELYISSNLYCNSLLYEINFGWGKPTWVTIPRGSRDQKNVVQLVDARKGDGSVEAWVSLREEDMALFERDEELLAYASVNPQCVVKIFSLESSEFQLSTRNC
ncbi:Transferase [Melia azedarach]|uniref:Transferase n=1 Tax=Melia azedarach TaxID=155640 RepID=A0ACC1XKQ8_MELAZ|nr:Transferase [Melia azedarach]